MNGIFHSPEELERWRKHNSHCKKVSAAVRKSGNQHNLTSESRKQQAIILYKKHSSLGYVCSTLRMGRNTLYNILSEAGICD